MEKEILVLDGGAKSDALTHQVGETLVRLAKGRGFSPTLLRLDELDIAPCLGCFSCWIKTPGLCVIDDAGRDVARRIVQSDVVVFLSPVVFGGYSPELKKALDRAIPLLSPFFRRIKGEVHHVKRYTHYPRLVGLGILSGHDEVEEELFEALIRRNAINLHAPKVSVGLLSARDDEETRDRRIEWVLAEGLS